jgi:hypothetical protein
VRLELLFLFLLSKVADTNSTANTTPAPITKYISLGIDVASAPTSLGVDPALAPATVTLTLVIQSIFPRGIPGERRRVPFSEIGDPPELNSVKFSTAKIRIPSAVAPYNETSPISSIMPFFRSGLSRVDHMNAVSPLFFRNGVFFNVCYV